MPTLPRQVVLTVNGPGEVSAWAFPVAAAFARRAPRVRVGVVVLPCVYGTGAEAAVAATLPGVSAVAAPGASMRWILRGVVPEGFDAAAPSCVLHLGGEPALTRALARRLGAPSAAYVERPIAWQRSFDRIFARDEALSRRIGASRATAVGDLIVDAARLRVPGRRPSRNHPPVIGVFPGSRVPLLRHMLPFFVRVAGLAREQWPDARLMIARASYVSAEDMAAAAAAADGRWIEGERARLDAAAGAIVLRGESGVRLEVATAADVMMHADVALTLPGTSTAELAALGIPMVVCAPSNKLDDVPLPGVWGYMHHLPLVGRPLKHAMVYLYGRRLRYLAHPNRRVRAMVVPEAIGRVTAAQVAGLLCRVLSEPAGPIEGRLREIMGPPGAADRVVGGVCRLLGAVE